MRKSSSFLQCCGHCHAAYPDRPRPAEIHLEASQGGSGHVREREARKAAEAARANEARLLAQSKAREMISQASILLAEGEVEKADRMLGSAPFSSIESTTEGLLVFRAYGDWNAIRKRWQKAADCYEYFIKADGLRRISSSEVSWNLMAMGVPQVEAGKTQAYNELREMAISYYSESFNYIFGAIVLKSCLLTPPNASVLEGLQPLVEVVESKLISTSPQHIDAQQGAFAAMSMAILEYRKGNFVKAQEWCRKTLKFLDADDARAATVDAIGAMSTQRLGQLELAHSELVKGRLIVKKRLELNALSSTMLSQGYWQDCAIARRLISEAEESIR